ncbi:unnamed protein product [Ceutorhynchus assimilis]|uniref:CHHC U11-48K-type domain-containing protein n=1 Tax=Ceutorhynchus assimilis TaxID=467358 RepID=A0A9N9MQG9_9CUCU|nr:unnamed protein product [Ceutorhynchus assimilis]
MAAEAAEDARNAVTRFFDDVGKSDATKQLLIGTLSGFATGFLSMKAVPPIMSIMLVKCPYNPLHVMPEESLQRHIVKCMKNYPQWVTCPYFAMHKFPNADVLGKHLGLCQYREIDIFSKITPKVEDLIDDKAELKNEPSLDQIRAINFSEENWDAEYNN